MKKFKKADRYVTFIPQNMEFTLIGYQEGMGIITSDPSFKKYGFEEVQNYVGKKYLRFLINSEEKLSLFTNAYELRYQACYQGEVFGALTDPDSPIVALVINSPEQSKGISGFVNYSKGEWVKEVDISEVTLIPIKMPIDLSRYLPKS